MLEMTHEPLKVGRNDPCICGSGKKFRRCCGLLGKDRPAPHGIVVLEDYLSAQECEEMVELLGRCPSERLKVIDSENSTEKETVRKYDDRRVTERVEVGELQNRLDDLIRTAALNEIEPKTGQKIEWFEEPQMLKYTPGGFYKGHADNAYFDTDTQLWVRCIDRDWSLLIYLGGDFEGGEILFNKFHFKVKPKRGMLVFFPSDGRYMHTALPVTSGVRYALVSWMSQLGIEKLREPPKEARFVNRSM